MKVADHSDCQFRHGCVIVRGGKILAIGFNKRRNTSTLDVFSSYTVHAEIDAISRTVDARSATVYVARINKRGYPMLSLPCPACVEVLTKKGIKKCVYTV
jgi:deoxycytidylate deaminase